MASLDDARDRLLDHATDMLSVEVEASEYFLSELEFLRYDVRKALLSYGETLPRRSANKAAREVGKLVEATYKRIEQGLIERVADAAGLSNKAARSILGKDVKKASAASLKATAEELLVQGVPLDRAIEQQALAVELRLGAAIRQGVAAGETTAQIVDRLLGTTTGVKRSVTVGGKKRVIAERAGGAINSARSDGDALARTAVQTAGTQALGDAYDAADDVIGTACQITLDLKTSAICRPRQGWAWNLKTGKPIPSYNTAPFNYQGSSPFHHRCRTIMVPVLRSEGGKVADGITYEDWLRKTEKKKPGTAERVFGNGQSLKAWLSGVSVNQLVNKAGVPLSAAQIANKYGDE